MSERSELPVGVRFGSFEVSSDSGELRKSGIRLKLSGQAIQVLLILLETPGRLVPREELQQKLWPGASFGDFDHGLNAAVNRLREVLGDSVTQPKFIETVPRRGYRFIGQIEPEQAAKAPSPPESSTGRDGTQARSWFRRRRWKVVLSVTGILLVTGVSALILMRQPSAPAEGVSVVPFTTYPGFEAVPSFSPDGNQIAFAWSKEGLNFDLYVKQIGQEHTVQLTHRPATYLVPAWSPDGRFIAFSRRGKDDTDTGIYLIPAPGGPERKVADTTPYAHFQMYLLSWSPDGKWLVFSKEDAAETKGDRKLPEARVHLLDVGTLEQKVLPAPSPDCAFDWQPAFAPDGKYLASICLLTEGDSSIYLQPTAGGPPSELILVKGEWLSFRGLTWSADSQSLLYSQDGSVWRVPVRGGKPERLSFAQDAQSPAVSRIGNKLAYVQAASPAHIWRLELAGPAKVAGPPTLFSSSTRGEGSPQVSADGKRVAFKSHRSGNLEIWVCDHDGSNPIQLSSFGKATNGGLHWAPESWGPHWAPDSHRIVFVSNASGKSELYIVDVDSRQPRRLETGTPDASGPYWSANGMWIYFNTQEPGAVWKVPVEGGDPVRLTKEGRVDPQESTDGKRVFYVVPKRAERSEEIWSVSVDGGDERLETPMTVNASWAPSQSGIYFLEGADVGLGRGRLRFFDFTTRRFQNLAELEPGAVFPGDMTVSRDGRTIYYAEIDQRAADIMIVEGFR